MAFLVAEATEPLSFAPDCVSLVGDAVDLLVDCSSILRFTVMSQHPENSPEVNKLMEEIGKAEVCDVWCKGCGDFRKMNAAYAAIIKTGEIESCSRCRQS